MHSLPLIHRASALGATSTLKGGTAKRGRVRRIDDVDNDAARLEPIRIHGHRVIGVHAQRRGVDNDFVSMWIGAAELRCATGCSGHGLREFVSATHVDVEYGECPGTCGRDSKSYCSTGASGTHEQNGFVHRVVPFPLHSEHAAEPIEHGTDPASIGIATDDVESADLTSRRMQFVHKSKHPLLMGHRDQHAGEISHRSCTGDKRGQVIRLHHERDANRVYPLLDKEPVPQCR